MKENEWKRKKKRRVSFKQQKKRLIYNYSLKSGVNKVIYLMDLIYLKLIFMLTFNFYFT